MTTIPLIAIFGALVALTYTATRLVEVLTEIRDELSYQSFLRSSTHDQQARLKSEIRAFARKS